MNNPLRYIDPSGHSPCGSSYSDPDCEEEDDNSNGGSTTTTTTTTTDPEEDDSDPVPGNDERQKSKDANQLEQQVSTQPSAQLSAESGPDWGKIAIGAAIVLIGSLAVGTIIAGIVLSGPAAPLLITELLVSSELWMPLILVSFTAYVDFQGLEMIAEGIQGK
jgi:hypothetical protein